MIRGLLWTAYGLLRMLWTMTFHHRKWRRQVDAIDECRECDLPGEICEKHEQMIYLNMDPGEY